MNEVIADINKVFPDKSIYYAKRDPREYKGKMKYSYRFYVDGVRITSKNLKALLMDLTKIKFMICRFMIKIKFYFSL